MDSLAGAILSVAMAACIASCAAQTKSSPPPPNACEIDAAAICQQGRQAELNKTVGAEAMDVHSRQQNGPATTEVFFPFTFASGHTLRINCMINNEHSTVVHATVNFGEPLNQADYDELRSHGACKS